MAKNIQKMTQRSREAARLELLGKSAAAIAEAIGVHVRQVTHWRASPCYREHVAKLQAEADRDAILKAGVVRADAIRLGHAAIATAASKLGKARTMKEVAEASGVAHDWYRTTSAQTGLAEVREQRVTLSTPEEALKRLDDRLKGLTADALRELAEDGDADHDDDDEG